MANVCVLCCQEIPFYGISNSSLLASAISEEFGIVVRERSSDSVDSGSVHGTPRRRAKRSLFPSVTVTGMESFTEAILSVLSPKDLNISSNEGATQKTTAKEEVVSASSKAVQDVLSALEQARNLFDDFDGGDEE